MDGDAEDLVLNLFEAAVRGEALPRKAMGNSPRLDHIPRIQHRSTFGVVEITRGCGRGCQFCSVALRAGKSIPLDQILDNVRVQVAEGADTILLTTEDLFLYEQGAKFKTNVPALKRLFTARFRLGMFDPPEMVPYTSIPMSVVGSQEHRETLLGHGPGRLPPDAVRDGIVSQPLLLKIEHIGRGLEPYVPAVSGRPSRI